MPLNSMSSDLVANENKNSVKEWHIEESLEFLGFGKVQYITLMTCGLISLTLVNQLMGTTFIMTSAQCDLNMTTKEKGLLASVTYIGVMLPAFMWGYLSDTCGRRKIMSITLSLMLLASVLSCFSPNFETFLVLRFFVGFFLAGPTSCFYPYIGELTPVKYRSMTLAWVTFVGSAAYIFLPVISYVILLLDFNIVLWDVMTFRPWRLIVLALAFPGIIAVIILQFLPESPKYLLSQHRKNEALEILKWIYQINTKQSVNSFHIKSLSNDDESPIVTPKKNNCYGVIQMICNQAAPLFKPPHIGNFLVLIFIQTSVFCVGTGMGLWFTELQNRLSKSSDKGTVCEIIQINANTSKVQSSKITECDDVISDETFINSLILGTCCLIGLLIISFATKIFARPWIIEINLVGTTLTGIALQFVTDPGMIVAVFCLFLTFSITSISVVFGSAVLLFPTSVRSMAQSITATFGRLGSAICGILIGMFIETQCEATFGVITVLVFVSACLTFLLPFKT